ncbi:MAG: Spore coat [Ramlibacter sp.]|nr:Spore coat [Ramlibacter sp.]MDB5915197.1 Spore coat [Ramlibacter sp.]
MKILLIKTLIPLALLFGLPAWSATTCTVTANPNPVKGIYTTTANLDMQGNLTVTCNRDPNIDPRKPSIWIGMAQPAAGRTVTQEAGVSTLAYTVAHRTYASGIWTDTGSAAATSTANGGVTDRLDFGNGGATVSVTYNFYFRVALSQVRPAGVYVDTLPVTLRLANETGAILGTTTIGIAISIPRACRFSTPPTAISVAYPAFSAAAVTGASNFALTCTQGTTYTIAIDRPRSVIPTVELAYGLTLSTTAATGTAVAQGYTVNISVDPGQAGRCGAATCTGTDSRTLTVTY